MDPEKGFSHHESRITVLFSVPHEEGINEGPGDL